MKSFFLMAAMVIAATCLGQKNTNPERAKSLKSIDKDAKLAASHSVDDYAFTIVGDKLNVIHNQNIDLISLQGNLNHVEHVYYNDNIERQEVEVKYTSGKSLKTEPICGNYEVEDIFYSDAKVCAYRFNFLYEGTEISLHAKTRYTDPRYLTKVFFHDDQPVAQRGVIFTIPTGVEVELVERNFEGYTIKKTSSTENGITRIMYQMENIPAMKSESNSLGILYHYPHLIVLTKKFKTAAGEKSIIASTGDLYSHYYGLVKQVKNDPAAFKDQVEKLTANLKTPEEKVKAIYYWVQDNIKYVAFEDGVAGFRPEAAQNVYTNRYGDCKGMANLTKEMLRAAGFDAKLAWIGTNRIPYTYAIPSLCVDNHMVCSLTVGGKQYVLDSTEKYIALGSNAERIQGKELMIESGESFVISKVPTSDVNTNLVARSETLAIDGLNLNGQGELTLNGESKKNVFYLSTNVKQEDQSKVFDNLAVQDYTNQDKVKIVNTPPVDREKPLDLKYSFTLANKISEFGQDLYVDLDWLKPFEDMHVEDSRQEDYYFNRKVKLKTTKKLQLPAGYKVTHLPKAVSRKQPGFSFDLSMKAVGNEVSYSNEITLGQGLVSKKDFAIWNDCIKELKDFYNDQLVLTKTK